MGQNMPTFRFYLDITDREDNPDATSSGPMNLKMKVLDEDGETVIEEIQIAKETVDDQVYDLSGRRIAKENACKGIYIINGKKVLVK